MDLGKRQNERDRKRLRLTDSIILKRDFYFQVKNDSCTVHDDFKNEIKTCYDTYAKSIEDKEPFGKMNGSALVLT